MKFIFKYLIAILILFSSDFYSQNSQEANILIKNTPSDILTFINKIEQGFPVKFGQKHIAVMMLGVPLDSPDATDIHSYSLYKTYSDYHYDFEKDKSISKNIFLNIIKRSSYTKYIDLTNEKSILEVNLSNLTNLIELNFEDEKIIVENSISQTNKYSGFGLVIKKNGDTYLGKIVENNINGFAVLKKQNGDMIFGDFIGDEINDRNGVMKFANNNYFIGGFNHNEIVSGSGKYILNGNAYYEGGFIDRMPNGYGTFSKYVKGKLISKEGNWINGKFSENKPIVSKGSQSFGRGGDDESNPINESKEPLIKEKHRPAPIVKRNTKPIIISCTNFIDNSEKYIGRTIMMEVGYASGNNGLNGLRKMQYDNYEQLFSLDLGFTEENETYNTRVVDCGGGSTFYIRIPKSIHSQLPNIGSSGYFKIGGVVKNSNTIVIIAGTR
jgi:hypothetical protein